MLGLPTTTTRKQPQKKGSPPTQFVQMSDSSIQVGVGPVNAPLIHSHSPEDENPNYGAMAGQSGEEEGLHYMPAPVIVVKNSGSIQSGPQSPRPLLQRSTFTTPSQLDELLRPSQAVPDRTLSNASKLSMFSPCCNYKKICKVLGVVVAAAAISSIGILTHLLYANKRTGSNRDSVMGLGYGVSAVLLICLGCLIKGCSEREQSQSSTQPAP